MEEIKPQSGTAFILEKGKYLKVIDPQGGQVSDFVFFNLHSTPEKLSAGKTMDFEETIFITKGNFLWSNLGRKMVEVVEDTNGRNDILLAPCSQETFTIMYNNPDDHPSCHNNLAENLQKYGITYASIPTAFNIFMHVQVDASGKISVLPPTSKAGDFVVLLALEDLLIGLTACSAEDSNGGTFKPIHYEILDEI